jgi:hypothetical protein
MGDVFSLLCLLGLIVGPFAGLAYLMSRGKSGRKRGGSDTSSIDGLPIEHPGGD